MCLDEVLVPHRLPHPAPAGEVGFPRREWIQRGGHVSGLHDALPQVGDGVRRATHAKSAVDG
jgi:hypothetical protein